MDPKQEFLILSRDYKFIGEALKEKAWEIAPDNIKELLCKEDGLFEGVDDEKKINEAKKWLIRPRHELGGKCATRTIIDGNTDKVIELLNRMMANTIF